MSVFWVHIDLEISVPAAGMSKIMVVFSLMSLLLSCLYQACRVCVVGFVPLRDERLAGGVDPGASGG